MIKNRKFFIKNLKNVVFIGYSDAFSELIEINNLLNLNTLIISSSDQSKKINKKFEFKIFDKLTPKFYKFIKSKFDIKKTIFISLGARYIFKKNTIKNLFSNNLVNFHSSRLPLDAGGGGYSWRIMREDRIDNQLVHLVDEGIDTGPIISNEISLFPKNCKIPLDFENYSFKKFISFYKNFIQNILKGKNFELKAQVNYLGRYNPRLNTGKDGFINWDMGSYELFNFINAFDDPYDGASTFLSNNKFGKLHLKKVHIHGGDSSNHPYMSGLVSRHDGKWIVVCTNSKHMLLVEEILNNKGKNVIKDIKVGDRFYTPLKELVKLRKTRTRINSRGLKK